MKVFMYTLSICPWSRKAKQFFKEKNIPFEYVDYDLAEEKEQEKILEAMYKCKDGAAFPFVKIDDEIVIGYSPERYSKLLSIASVDFLV